MANYVLSERTAQRLLEVLRRYGNGGATFFPSAHAGRWVGYVEVTGEVDDILSMVRCTNYLSNDETWETYDLAWAVEANGLPLITGGRYLAVRAGDLDAGSSGGSGGSGSGTIPLFVAFSGVGGDGMSIASAVGDITARSGPTPGTGSARLYAIDGDPETLHSTGDLVTVWNYDDFPIDSGRFFTLWQETSGEYVVISVPDDYHLTVKEVDGSPALEDIAFISFDSADGFSVSADGTGRARVDMATATPSQVGIVSTSGQSFGGEKTFDDGIQCGNSTINQDGGSIDLRSVTGTGDAGASIGFPAGTSFFGVSAWDAGGPVFPANTAGFALISSALPGVGCFQIVQNTATGYADSAYSLVDSTITVRHGTYATLLDGSTVHGGLVTSAGTTIARSAISLGPLSGTGAPSPTDGLAGDTYFDVTDPSNPQLYYKT